MTVLVGIPTTPTSRHSPPWTLAQMTYTGPTGRVWSLCGPGADAFLMPGVRGIDKPEWSIDVQDSPGVAGSLFRSARTTAREVYWPLELVDDDGMLPYRDAALSRDLQPSQPGYWWVSTPLDPALDQSGLPEAIVEERYKPRTLEVWYVSRNDDRDSEITITDRLVYGINLKAYQPYWMGPQIVREWRPSAQYPFIEPPDDGTSVIWFNSSYTIDDAELPNPGDVPAAPVFTIHGPCTGATIGVGDDLVSAPIALALGESLTIDCTAKTAIDNTGRNRTSELGQASFSLIDPFETVKLTIDIAGTDGWASATLTPLYEMAYG